MVVYVISLRKIHNVIPDKENLMLTENGDGGRKERTWRRSNDIGKCNRRNNFDSE